jgi:hypothetical protein
MRRLRWYVGTETVQTQGNYYKAKTDAERFLLNLYGGCTIYNGRGAWLSPNGTVYREDCLVFEVLSENGGSDVGARGMAQRLKELFAQESVLLTIEDVGGEFV